MLNVIESCERDSKTLHRQMPSQLLHVPATEPRLHNLTWKSVENYPAQTHYDDICNYKCCCELRSNNRTILWARFLVLDPDWSLGSSWQGPAAWRGWNDCQVSTGLSYPYTNTPPRHCLSQLIHSNQVPDQTPGAGRENWWWCDRIYQYCLTLWMNKLLYQMTDCLCICQY